VVGRDDCNEDCAAYHDGEEEHGHHRYLVADLARGRVSGCDRMNVDAEWKWKWK